MISKQIAWLWPVGGSIAVLVISPVITALTGKENAYALVLLPLNLLLWAMTRLSLRNMGLRIGKLPHYIFSFLYPLAVIGIAGFIALLAGKIQAENILLADISKNVLALFLVGIIGVVLTEEGFFRGWLWGILEKANFRPGLILIWASIVFCVWHYAVTVMVFNLPVADIPIYLGNILLIGFVFGFLRQASGSILIPSLSHALWNALSYTFFGMGEKVGALDIASRKIFDPEMGVLGLLLNLIAVILFWRMTIKKG